MNQVIQLGLESLQGSQQSNGGFLSLSSPDIGNFEGAIKFHSIFSTTLILQNLFYDADSRDKKNLQKKITKFLLKQKKQYGSWNYWVEGSVEAKKFPYPDDLDDTFCALSGLFLTDEKLINGKVLAQASQLLAALEVGEGGPYRTWVIDSSANKVWLDIDLVVNANIAYFLRLQDIVLPKLTKFFHRALAAKKLQSPYYPVTSPILYFLSRVIISPKYKKFLIKLILEAAKDISDEPLYMALVIQSLLFLDYPVQKLTDFAQRVSGSQNPDGSWSAATFYTGVNPQGKRNFYGGSSELTTSFCLAALAQYEKKFEAINLVQNKKNKQMEVVQKLIKKEVKIFFIQLDPQLQSLIKPIWKKIALLDKAGQISLLPYFFREAIEKQGEKIPDEMLAKLGVAGLYGWMAYTLYDAILDSQMDLSALSAANIFLRAMTQIFVEVLPDMPDWQQLSKKILDDQDAVNVWELAHCRFQVDQPLAQINLPQYGNYTCLAQRSMGHALGAVAVLISLGYRATSVEVKNLLDFFKHFLIARQLNDDAHDWQADLALGQINSSSVLILVRVRKIFSHLSLSAVLPQLPELFWQKVVDEVCNEIEKQVQLAKKALNQIKIISHPDVFLRLLDQQMKAVELVRKEKLQAIEFVKATSFKTGVTHFIE